MFELKTVDFKNFSISLKKGQELDFSPEKV